VKKQNIGRRWRFRQRRFAFSNGLGINDGVWGSILSKGGVIYEF
jgi:hypothetical protein